MSNKDIINDVMRVYYATGDMGQALGYLKDKVRSTVTTERKR